MIQNDKRICDGVGLWLENCTGRDWDGLPGLFLDRDGVILEETGYLGRVEDVRLVAGAATLIRWANRQRIPVIVVTNQSGIGRGYYDWQDFAAVQSELDHQLQRDGAQVDFVVACAYHGDGKPPFAIDNHPWRKPNPGMIMAVRDQCRLDLSRSVLVGDKWTDLEAAARVGMARGLLVKTGHGAQQANIPFSFEPGSMQIDIAESLEEALAIFKQETSSASG
tara:strand:- start:191082 stop:191747 length:666 start_codon:yes stop_codon:yes gene_type:complete